LFCCGPNPKRLLELEIVSCLATSGIISSHLSTGSSG
jgi:hypothetical protein